MMRARARAAVAALLVLLGASACGKKGDPLPPLLPIPQTTEDLTVAQRGGELLLDFAYPRTTAAGMPLPELERVEVYRLVRPALPQAPPPPPTTEEPGEPEEEAEQDAAPTVERYIAPRIEQHELEGAATVALTLPGDEITAAVRGDRLALSLPLETPLPAEPEAHYFAVRTTARGNYPSALSNRVSIVPEPPPLAPRDLGLTPRAEGVEVTWRLDEPPATGADPAETDPAETDPGAEPSGFNVYRRAATERGFGPPVGRTGPVDRSYLDRTAQYGQRYVYAVTAVAGRRPLIESAIAETREVDYRDRFAPPVPEGLVALADGGSVRLVWDPSRAPDLAGYLVYRSDDDGEWRRLTPEPIVEVEHGDPTVEVGATYRYRVTAVDRLGNESEPGTEVEVLAR